MCEWRRAAGPTVCSCYNAWQRGLLFRCALRYAAAVAARRAAPAAPTLREVGRCLWEAQRRARRCLSPAKREATAHRLQQGYSVSGCASGQRRSRAAIEGWRPRARCAPAFGLWQPGPLGSRRLQLQPLKRPPFEPAGATSPTLAHLALLANGRHLCCVLWALRQTQHELRLLEGRAEGKERRTQKERAEAGGASAKARGDPPGPPARC